MRNLILIGLLMIFGMAPAAWAEEPAPEAAPPKVIAPSFPLEPQKKASQVINPKTYVEGKDEPPPADPKSIASIPRVGHGFDEWWDSLEIGWFFASESAKHEFSGLANTEVRRSNSNPLSLMGRFEMRPPHFPLSWIIGGAATTGSAQAVTAGNTFNPVQFSCQDARGAIGIRLHPLSRLSKSDLRLGADLGAAYQSMTTLTAAQDNVDVDPRTIFFITPKIAYQFAPQDIWYLHSSLGYMIPLKTSGNGNVSANFYRRIEAEIDAVRYVSPGVALGLGGYFAYERAIWNQTNPSVLSDYVITQDLRLNLFLRTDF